MDSTRRTYRFELRPISLNNAYPDKRDREGKVVGRRKSKAASGFSKAVEQAMWVEDSLRKLDRPHFPFYCVTYIFWLPQHAMFYKNGRLRKEDLSNFIKLTEDSILGYIQSDDSEVLEFHPYKRVRPRGSGDGFLIHVVIEEASMEAGILDTTGDRIPLDSFMEECEAACPTRRT